MIATLIFQSSFRRVPNSLTSGRGNDRLSVTRGCEPSAVLRPAKVADNAGGRIGDLPRIPASDTTILANQGIDPLSPVYSLLHLELGRVLVRQKQIPAARTEYQSFLDVWKNADADLTLPQSAKREYAALN
jgi:hypothetical protein